MLQVCNKRIDGFKLIYSKCIADLCSHLESEINLFSGPCVCAMSYWLLGSRITYIIGGLALFIPIKVLSLLQKIEAKHLKNQKSS